MSIQNIHLTIADTNSYVNIMANSIGKITLKVFNTQGRIAKTINTTITQGIHQLNLNLTDLTSGSYVINAFNGDRFIKAMRFNKF